MPDPVEEPEEPLSSGRAVASTVSTMASLGALGTRVLAEHGIDDVDTDRWYSYKLRREIHEEAYKRFGDAALYSFGFAMGDYYAMLVGAIRVAHEEYLEHRQQSDDDEVWRAALSDFLH